MRRPPSVAKRDANEGIIFDTLQAFGFSIYPLDVPLDALAGYGGRTFLVEVKSRTGTLTGPQEKFLKAWRGQYVILRSSEAAVTWARKVRKGEI